METDTHACFHFVFLLSFNLFTEIMGTWRDKEIRLEKKFNV